MQLPHYETAPSDSRTCEKINVRLPDGMRDAVSVAAKNNQQSTNNWVVGLITRELDNLKNDQPPSSRVWNPQTGMLVAPSKDCEKPDWKYAIISGFNFDDGLFIRIALPSGFTRTLPVNELQPFRVKR